MMSDRQKPSVSKIQGSHKSATRWQERRRLTCLVWILIAVVIAIGLAFLPGNQDIPAMEIRLVNSPSERHLYESDIDLSHAFWQCPAKHDSGINISAPRRNPNPRLTLDTSLLI